MYDYGTAKTQVRIWRPVSSHPISSSTRVSNAKTTRLSPGAFATVFGLPVLLLTLFFVCNDKTGCPAPSTLSPFTLTLEKLKAETPWPADGIWGFCSWEAMGWNLAYYLISLILYRVLPAQELLGTKLVQSGRPLKYRFNCRFTVLSLTRNLSLTSHYSFKLHNCSACCSSHRHLLPGSRLYCLDLHL